MAVCYIFYKHLNIFVKTIGKKKQSFHDFDFPDKELKTHLYPQNE